MSLYSETEQMDTVHFLFTSLIHIPKNVFISCFTLITVYLPQLYPCTVMIYFKNSVLVLLYKEKRLWFNVI